MTTLYPFFFRFGVSFNYLLPKEIISSLISFLSTYDTDIILSDDKENYDCISISDQEALSSSVLAVKFNERLVEYGISNFETSIFFIDLRKLYNDKFVNDLIDELIKIKKNNLDRKALKKEPKFFLYFDDIDLKSSSSDKFFTSQVKNKLLDYCYIFDSSGHRLQYQKGKLKLIDDRDILKLINDISTSSLERFEFKLVRKINHFKKIDQENQDWVACQQFFYEARNCDEETYRALLDEILQLKKEHDINPDLIVYDCFYSEWLRNPLESVVDSITSIAYESKFPNLYKNSKNDSKRLLDLNDKTDIRNKKDWIDSEVQKVLLITDLIDTSVTLKSDIEKINVRFPNIKNIYCISTLITDHAFENFKDSYLGDKRKIKIDGYEINYFKKVEQIYKPKTAHHIDCPMCKHNLLKAVLVSEETLEDVSSYEMWYMCKEAGYIIEKYKPRKGRENINNAIPDSLKLFQKNGPLIALKFEQRLKKAGIPTLQEIVVIFPDESQNPVKVTGEKRGTIEKTPSGYLAKSLHFYNSNFKYLGIPRRMIQLVEEPNTDWKQLETDYIKIFREIDKIKSPIVIIDENNFSGTTFMAIADILRHKGKKPISYFPIFNYDARNTINKYEEQSYNKINFFSLYEFSLDYSQ